MFFRRTIQTSLKESLSSYYMYLTKSLKSETSSSNFIVW